MKILKTNAEYQLKSLLDMLRAQPHPGWQGMLFKFSLYASAEERKEAEKIVFGLITDCAAEKDGGLFFCEDGDIILVVRGLEEKDRRDLATVLSVLMPPLPSGLPRGDEVVVSYAITPSDIKLDIVCADKLKALRNNKDAPHKTDSTAEVKLSVSSSLFAKACAVRQKRTKPCLLLVEDDPASLFLTKRALTKDFDVLTATGGAEAIETYSNHAPDMVFLDIGLPDISGHAVLQQLIKLDPQVAIVMLSANSFRDEIVKAMKQGARGFVAKPFSRAKLLHYITQLVPSATKPTGAGLLQGQGV